MKPIAEIFSQGEEVVNGQIIDSNAAWLSQQLSELGFQLRRHTAVGDNLDDLIELFKEIAERADCCICTGGLGPTQDDLTTEAVGTASGLALRFDEQALKQIQFFFECRNRSMPQINRKQAYLPESALRIDNVLGTAPGFALQFRRTWFVFLPGVPAEMKAMFNSQVRQDLAQRFSLQTDHLVSLKSIGIGESAIQQNLENLALPAPVRLGFRASMDEVHTKLLFPAGFPHLQKQALVGQVAKLIGDYVYAIDGLNGLQGGLVDVINQLMLEKAQTLAVLETLSHGLIAAKCIDRPWLHTAEICLDKAKLHEDGFAAPDESDLSAAAASLAAQVKYRRGSDFALVQLFDGDQSGIRDKDRSIVLYNALCTADGVVISRNTIAGAVAYKQNQAALLALDLLRRYLQNKCH